MPAVYVLVVKTGIILVTVNLVVDLSTDVIVTVLGQLMLVTVLVVVVVVFDTSVIVS